MKSYFYHLQININFVNLPFYKKLMKFLGWSVIFENNETAGFRSGKNGDLWFCKSLKNETTDYDGYGVNHISLRVEDLKHIDEFALFLKQNEIPLLFDTPKHRPEFASTKNETYYQVMFESPDKILFEIVYIGVKTERTVLV